MAKVLRNNRRPLSLAALLLTAAPVAHAVDFGDMFNPGRWFGGGDDDYYYDEGPWGPYGPGPYGAPGYGPYGGPGPYGAPGYGAPGYGAPGYGAPGYGAPGFGGPGYAAPGYGTPAPAATPKKPNGGGSQASEIEALKRRIEELEASRTAPAKPQQQAPSASSEKGWPPSPAFRPMDQY